MVRDALSLMDEGKPGTAQFCAYDAGTSAGMTSQPPEACPFDSAKHPDLADAWERGRSQTIAFQAGRARRSAARRLARSTPPRTLTVRYVGGTHAAHAHPED